MLPPSHNPRVALTAKKIPDSSVNSTAVQSPLTKDMTGPGWTARRPDIYKAEVLLVHHKDVHKY